MVLQKNYAFRNVQLFHQRRDFYWVKGDINQSTVVVYSQYTSTPNKCAAFQTYTQCPMSAISQ